MTAAPTWSRRRWAVTVLLLLISQFCLVVLLSSYPTFRNSPITRATRIRIVSNQTYDSCPEIAAKRDPTVFALVHPRGFSGAAWLRTLEFPYPLTELIDPPRWLAVDVATLGSEFTEFVQATANQTPPATPKPRPHLATILALTRSFVLRPSLRIEGDLENRRWSSSQALPAAELNPILTNCVISITVAPNGDVFSPLRLTSSGSDKTDQAVLDFAKSLRFSPLNSGPTAPFPSRPQYDFGRLVFQWLPVDAEAHAPLSDP